MKQRVKNCRYVIIVQTPNVNYEQRVGVDTYIHINTLYKNTKWNLWDKGSIVADVYSL